MSLSLRPEKTSIKLLYLRLTDSAPLIIAKEKGYFHQLGLDVQLHRETSWATLRDKLIGRKADAAAMLAPMPLALKQALPNCREQLLSGLILSCNGNAITLSEDLFHRLQNYISGSSQADIAAALKRYLLNNAGSTPVRLATVYPFSSHSLQLRHWLRSANIDPDREIQLVVLPPEQMLQNLHSGVIDGYCVGEPWNTLAAHKGAGAIITACNSLLPAMPEKVLAVTKSWHEAHPATHLALRAALLQACTWLAARGNRRIAAGLLSQKQYLDLPETLIQLSLSDQILFRRDAAIIANPGWHLFAHKDNVSGRPCADKASQLLEMCKGFSEVSPQAEKAFRADLYRQTVDFLLSKK
ncbi:CmpA/NrtA family ABC transporter substrate-binding protein [Microbulbifer sp. MLAF003]|uniref:CmpA/NrtA family ABC transporter substrate-binding protein n=1 Tax=Microbulbifer TaxID=48073 RepID=UPI0003780615|nr:MULTISPECIES: CmpA/NrtA family ABC transporter substrate-binding protein [Microbulbifer]WHI52003.1 CmpA/NrtA family ABC transporter substrate-binding protein [Microbulbifer sp. MLAF003]